MFSMEGPIYRLLSFLYRCMVLNLLYLFSCILIVTIPPATAGLFTVARKYVGGDEPPVFQTFWRGFRENWKQSWIVAIVFIVVGWILWVDIRVFELRHWALSGIASILLLVITLVVVTTFLHIFPLMVHMEQTTRRLFINALKLNLVKPQWSILNLALLYAWFFVSESVRIAFLVLFFTITAMMTYWCTDKKFKAIMARQERDDQETHEAADRA